MSSPQEGNKLIMESYFFHITVIISKKEEKLCSCERGFNQTVRSDGLFLQFRASFQTILYLSNFFFLAAWHSNVVDFLLLFSLWLSCQSPVSPILRGP